MNTSQSKFKNKILDIENQQNKSTNGMQKINNQPSQQLLHIISLISNKIISCSQFMGYDELWVQND